MPTAGVDITSIPMIENTTGPHELALSHLLGVGVAREVGVRVWESGHGEATSHLCKMQQTCRVAA